MKTVGVHRQMFLKLSPDALCECCGWVCERERESWRKRSLVRRIGCRDEYSTDNETIGVEYSTCLEGRKEGRKQRRRSRKEATYSYLKAFRSRSFSFLALVS